MRAARAAKEGNNVQEGSEGQDASVDEFIEALRPLLTFVCSQVCIAKPENALAFVAVRLLEHCSAPEDLLLTARQWLNANADQALAPKRPSAESPKKQRPKMSRSQTGSGLSVETSERTPSAENEVAFDPCQKTPPLARKESEVIWSSKKGTSEASILSVGAQDEVERLFGRQKGKRTTGHGNACSVTGYDNANSRTSPSKIDSRRRRFTAASERMVEMGLPEEDELLDVLRKVPCLAKLSEDDLRKAAQIAKCQRHDTDQAVIALGSRQDMLHIILEGTAGVSVPHQVHTLSEGQYFGNEHLLPSIALTEEHYSALRGQVTTIAISAVDFAGLGITKNHVDKNKADRGRLARNFANVSQKRGSVRGSLSTVDGLCLVTGFPVIQEKVDKPVDAATIQAAVRHNNVMGDVIQLVESQCEKISESVYLVAVKRDQVVFEKGTRGSSLFIVQEGLLDVTLEQGKEGEFKFRAGDAFGELGLLYDAPRAATVAATTDCKLWVLTRSMFQTVIRSVHSAQITEHANILKNIPYLLTQVAETNIDLVAEMVEEMLLLETEDVCIAGEDAGQLFVVFDGRCEVRAADGETIRTLNRGDWIGEEQLAHNLPAEYTVRVVSESAVVLSLDIASLRMAAGTAASLDSTVLFKGEEGQIEKTMQAHDLIDKSLKKALKNYERTQGKGEFPDLKQHTVVGGLGEGSFGNVFLTEHEPSGSRFALKMVSKQHVIREQLGNMMRNERDIMMLLDSAFVVRLFRAYHDADHIYLLTELVIGGELFDVYNDRDLFCNLNAAKFYISNIIMGLEHLHEKRVIYRDLKLENCLLDSDGYVKLMDMGIAKVVVGKTYTVCGTADYLAPETLRQLGHNRAVDWWACSVLLFIMCSGRSPFDAPDVQQIYKNIIKGFSKVKFPDTFPSDLTDVIKSLGRKQPEERLTMQKGGVENLREMPYFTRLDWLSLVSRQVEPPFVPDPLNVEKCRQKQLSMQCDLSRSDITEWDGCMVVDGCAAGWESEAPPELRSDAQ